jgi:hydrogenase nickel incorporation protein HypA/HybF
VHELGIIIEIVKSVELFARQNAVSKIDTLVLQIGELSSIVPAYIESCYPVAVDKTFLQDTKLKIEIIPGNAMCRPCNKVFNVLSNDGVCPHCKGKDWELISGKEFMIKELLAY